MTKNTAATKPRAPAPPGLKDFSDALAARFPNRMIKRFVMPSNIRAAREVFIMELTNKELVDASIFADASMSKIERQSQDLSADAEKRENIRASIVGVGRMLGGVLTYEHTNADGIPFMAIDNWAGNAWIALRTYFGQLNGIPMEELSQGIEGAQAVGAFALPLDAEGATSSPSPSGADTGQSAAD